jgi:hydroxymethylglutaryl-CoA synthase
MQLGIDDLSFATADQYLDLADLAPVHGVEPAKYSVGLGQERMSVASPDEDVVTLAAAAAQPIVADLDDEGRAAIRTVLLATESGIDQSKSAGVYVHHLLGLNPACRVVELKQACYSGTSALQMALALVARNPEQKVLVICSDVARYDIGSSGEPTQGAGAVAMLITADPRLVAIEPVSGLNTTDVMDFWRPNYRTTAVVDGRLSLRAYTDSLSGAWADLQAQGGPAFADIDTFCYHQPFTKMAVKAHQHLTKLVGAPRDPAVLDAQIGDSLRYNKQIGNSYTASMYLGLISLLDHADEDLSGNRIGFFSYGSGAVGEFFTGLVVPGYREHLRTAEHRRRVDERRRVSHEEYLRIVAPANPVDGGEHPIPVTSRSPFRLAAITEHQRIYVRADAADVSTVAVA